MPPKTASEAYHERQAEIKYKLKQIKSKLKNHEPEHINWAHVGDLGRISELLDEVLGGEK